METSYSGSIKPYQSDIIPLFWIDNVGNNSFMSDITLTAGSDMVWNMITQDVGTS
jgi:hypothetical protein